MSKKQIISRVLGFFQQDIWQVNWDVLPFWQSLLYRQIRIVVTVIHEFQKDDVYLRASALTFFSMLSVVPVFALGFGLAKGFGLEKDLRKYVLDSAVGQEQIINQILDFATTLINNTQGGLVAGVGLVLLLYTVLKLLNNIEASFNDIWGVKTHRTLARKLSDYIAIVFAAPILMVTAGSFMIVISTFINALIEQGSIFQYIGPALFMVIKITPYILVWLLFILVYLIMPNTKVRVKSAMIGGVLAGTCFVFTQYLYIEFQVGVAQANAIYGSFAALPLFLIWLNVSWLITLIGAEIAYAHQNAERYQVQGWAGEPSAMLRRQAALLIVYQVVVRFMAGKSALTMPQIASELKLPLTFTQKLMSDLHAVNILSRVEQGDDIAYQPAQDPDRLSIVTVTQALDQMGDDSLKLQDSEALQSITATLAEFGACIRATHEERPLHALL